MTKGSLTDVFRYFLSLSVVEVIQLLQINSLLPFRLYYSWRTRKTSGKGSAYSLSLLCPSSFFFFFFSFIYSLNHSLIAVETSLLSPLLPFAFVTLPKSVPLLTMCTLVFTYSRRWDFLGAFAPCMSVCMYGMVCDMYVPFSFLLDLLLERKKK